MSEIKEEVRDFPLQSPKDQEAWGTFKPGNLEPNTLQPELLDEALKYIQSMAKKPRTGAEKRKGVIKFNPESVPERIRNTVDILLIELEARHILANAVRNANESKCRTLEPDFSNTSLQVIDRVHGIIGEYGGRVK